MISLLDVNVLIALVDGDHAHHETATDYFRVSVSDGWATCPVTENGFLRILGHPSYPGGPGSPNEARRLLAAYCAAPGHQFWSDDISLTDRKLIAELPTPKGLTDVYLLALATKRGGRLVTLDRGNDTSLVVGGNLACLALG